MTYRADIDGLRAIAVLSVVLFHWNEWWMPGGFVGVDVFFVISGFLISKIIFSDIRNDRFSIANFYSRRIRRIFPALLVVMSAVIVAGYFVLLPDEFIQAGKHLAAGASFLSNVALWKESGYFDVAADLKPLLHLWSLAVEEQFYIFWPPLVVLGWRIGNGFFRVLLLAFVISMVCNLITVHHDLAAAYFLPFARVWELLIGAGLAYCHVTDRRVRFLSEKSQSIIGLALIILSVFFVDKTKSFPGLWALGPTMGAFFLISAGSKTWINRRLLSHPCLVFIGLISYPLYLWHWPLLSFVRICFSGKHIIYGEVVAVVLSVGLSWMTYRWIEIPLRRANVSVASKNGYLVGSMVAALVFGVLAFKGKIEPRLFSVGKEISDAKNDWKGPEVGFANGKLTVDGLRGTSNDSVLFLGDSHLAQYWPRIQFLYSGQNQPKLSVIYATNDGCPPMPETHWKERQISCDDYFAAALEIAVRKNIKRVVFGAYWEYYLKGFKDYEATMTRFESLILTLRKLGKEVVIVLSNPTGEEFSPNVMIPSRFSGKVSEGFLAVDRIQFENRVGPFMNRLREIAGRTNSGIIDPVASMCDDRRCPTTIDGKPIYKDTNHLRPFFAKDYALFMDQTVSDGDDL
ncbi:MAG: acyltransferase [Bdellovibrio sp. CG10_big_fil_rev_8_21_14_0_10_47_8]|nr:MAG: acyltransferase [Bdellovibrio sp. CG10_big_fil_rev_8_21_14_0_10_47_8]